MALPDLSTSNISWLGYWNFLDNGGSSIDPLEVASALNSYDEYSNGIEGVYEYTGFSNTENKLLNVRVKDDGWFVVWLPTGSDEAQPAARFSPLEVSGEYDIVDDWTNWNSMPDLNSTMHSIVIQNLYGNLSNSGEATFNHGDVGHHHYQHPDATTFTMLSLQSSNANTSHTFTTSANITIYWAWALAAVVNDEFSTAQTYFANNQESITLLDGNDQEIACYEIADRGIIQADEQIDWRCDFSQGHKQLLTVAWA